MPQLERDGRGWRFRFVGPLLDVLSATTASSLLEAIRADGWERFGRCAGVAVLLRVRRPVAKPVAAVLLHVSAPTVSRRPRTGAGGALRPNEARRGRV